MIIGTGFEDTETNCDLFSLIAHGLLCSQQMKNDIGYNIEVERYCITVKHATEDRYFAVTNKEDNPVWEVIIDSIMTQAQKDSHGDIDLGEET